MAGKGRAFAADDRRIEYVGRTLVCSLAMYKDHLSGKVTRTSMPRVHAARKESHSAASVLTEERNERIVAYDWGGVSIEMEVIGTTRVLVDMVGGGNVFVVRVDGVVVNRLRTTNERQIYTAVQGLDSARMHSVSIVKITEAAPFIIHLLMSLQPVVVHGFILDEEGELCQALPMRPSVLLHPASGRPSTATQSLRVSVLTQSVRLLESEASSSSPPVVEDGLLSTSEGSESLKTPSPPEPRRRSSDSSWESETVASSPRSSACTHLRRILFIGDSDTNGFAAESTCPELSLSCLTNMKKTENLMAAFGWLVAEAFSARAHFIAWSGKGVLRNAVDLSIIATKQSKATMTECMDRTLVALPHSRWDNSKFAPHLVVVYLGCNDFYSKPHPPANTFSDAYLRLLRKAIKPHVDEGWRPTVVCIVGGFFPNYAACKEPIIAAVNAFKREHDDVHVVAVPEDIIDRTCDFGCLEHLNVTGHAKVARFLVGEISRITGWTHSRPDNPSVLEVPVPQSAALIGDEGAHAAAKEADSSAQAPAVKPKMGYTKVAPAQLKSVSVGDVPA